MLMESLERWVKEQNPPLSIRDLDEDTFSIFYQEFSAGKTFVEMLCLLAYETYELQVCMDGILEDI